MITRKKIDRKKIENHILETLAVDFPTNKVTKFTFNLTTHRNKEVRPL